jgi:hypothetical protein
MLSLSSLTTYANDYYLSLSPSLLNKRQYYILDVLYVYIIISV